MVPLPLGVSEVKTCVHTPSRLHSCSPQSVRLAWERMHAFSPRIYRLCSSAQEGNTISPALSLQKSLLICFPELLVSGPCLDSTHALCVHCGPAQGWLCLSWVFLEAVYFRPDAYLQPRSQNVLPTNSVTASRSVPSSLFQWIPETGQTLSQKRQDASRQSHTFLRIR